MRLQCVYFQPSKAREEDRLPPTTVPCFSALVITKRITLVYSRSFPLHFIVSKETPAGMCFSKRLKSLAAHRTNVRVRLFMTRGICRRAFCLRNLMSKNASTSGQRSCAACALAGAPESLVAVNTWQSAQAVLVCPQRNMHDATSARCAASPAFSSLFARSSAPLAGLEQWILGSLPSRWS